MQQVSTCRDVTKQFLECFPGRECRTLAELQTKLAQFQRLTGTSYTRCSSVTASTFKKRSQQIIPMEIGYSMLLYKCVHTSVRRNADKRGRLYKDYNCGSYFRIVYRDKCLQIIRFNMCHNHDLSSTNWQIYPSNRKLSEEQERTLLSILPSCPSYMVIRNYVQTNYGITLTRDDFRNLRKRIACLEQQLVASETTQLTNHNASLPRTSSHLPAFRDSDSNVAESENHNLTESSTVTNAKDRRDIAAQLTFEIFNALVRLDSTWFNYYHALFTQILEHMCPSGGSAPEMPKVGTTLPGHAQLGIGSLPNSSSAAEIVVQNYKPILPKPQPGTKWTPPNSSRRPIKRSSWLALSSNTTTATTKRRRKTPLDRVLSCERQLDAVLALWPNRSGSAKIPLDLDECSPEERQRRLLRRTPRARLALQEEIEDTFDRSAYEFLLK
ncbi:hypothetical protein T265_05564 [Opisthorchis viverrini]|uniref:FAR1 domain-containing protein n=1 Tax=Opisthorchis viverrini TaxID=6198 RepID=A0A075AF58_OPIVI|nr:hypothetical protein T265_05564 [Opisthorchis viverrini]KER27389.1 hypothetical protein T265_05564 [Opisthorchis viverrini]